MAPKTIQTLLEYLDTEQLQLPEIQREFVWTRKSIKLLFDSLYKDLPIGQMLVWKTSTEVTHGSFHGKKHKKSAGKIANFYGYLLDGQQRLTAITRVRESDDDYPLLFDLWPKKEDHYERWPFFWGKLHPSWGPWVVPVSEVLDSNFSVNAHLERIKTDANYQASYGDEVLKALSKLKGILDYPIEVTEFESDDYRQATELFIRFNSTGKRLNKSDLALAELATHVHGLAANDIAKTASQWRPNFDFTRPFMIQCLAAVHTDRMNLQKPRDLWNGAEAQDIRESWKMTRQGLAGTVHLLTGTLRWDSGNWVPSFNALVPLIYIIAHTGSLTAEDRRLARSWLILTTMRAHFSGSVYSELDRILRRLATNPNVSELWKATKKSLAKLKPEEFEASRRSGALMSLYISMLRDKNAKDWKGETPLDGSVLGKNAKLHIRHFFPKALMLKHGYSLELINTFANLTLISADANLDILMEEPATYLKRLKVDSKQLDIQCIPPDESLWHVDRYEEFLDARRKMLAQRANEYLDV
jgi:hypothetical protein